MENKRPRSDSDEAPKDKNQEAINRRREQMNFEIAEAMRKMDQPDSGDSNDDDKDDSDDVMTDAWPALPPSWETATSSSQGRPVSPDLQAVFSQPATPLSSASTFLNDLALQLDALPDPSAVESDKSAGSALRTNQEQRQALQVHVPQNIGQRQMQLRQQRRAAVSDETMPFQHPECNSISSSSRYGNSDNRVPIAADLSVAVQPPLFAQAGELQRLPFVVRAAKVDDGSMFTVRPVREAATSLASMSGPSFTVSSAMDEDSDKSGCTSASPTLDQLVSSNHPLPAPAPASGVRFPSRFRHHDGVPMRSQDSREAPFHPAAFTADILLNKAALFRELPPTRDAFEQATRRHHMRTPAAGAEAEAYCLLGRFVLPRPGSWRVGMVARDWNGGVTGGVWSREVVVVDRALTHEEREANEFDSLLRREAERGLLERLRMDAEYRGEPWP
ncbi:hypothetical protein MN608_10701 [Microdochium nivale]|nr:hypothetical protein MN608_10701 [Microdochium nivale]